MTWRIWLFSFFGPIVCSVIFIKNQNCSFKKFAVSITTSVKPFASGAGFLLFCIFMALCVIAPPSCWDELFKCLLPCVDFEPSQADCALVYYISGIWHSAWLLRANWVLWDVLLVLIAVVIWPKYVTGGDTETETSVLVFFSCAPMGWGQSHLSTALAVPPRKGNPRPVLALLWVFPGGSDGKASARNVGDPESIPGLGRSPGEGNGNPLQYSCLENPMDGGAWWATVHGVAKSRTWLSDFTLLYFCEKYYKPITV